MLIPRALLSCSRSVQHFTLQNAFVLPALNTCTLRLSLDICLDSLKDICYFKVILKGVVMPISHTSVEEQTFLDSFPCKYAEKISAMKIISAFALWGIFHVLQHTSRLGLRACKEAHDSFIGENTELRRARWIPCLQWESCEHNPSELPVQVTKFRSCIPPFICYTHINIDIVVPERSVLWQAFVF